MHIYLRYTKVVPMCTIQLHLLFAHKTILTQSDPRHKINLTQNILCKVSNFCILTQNDSDTMMSFVVVAASSSVS